jgi:hypothetical protein
MKFHEYTLVQPLFIYYVSFWVVKLCMLTVFLDGYLEIVTV